MRTQDAIDRLSLIHDQLARAEVYPGFRPPAVALVGVFGLLAAAVQPDASAVGFVTYWLAVAAGGAALGFASAARSYAREEDELARRRTRRVMAQFLPALFAGTAVTLGVWRAGPEVTYLLLGLGVIAARPHLPAAVWAVGVGYVIAGAALLLTADPTAEPSGWAVGGVFGIGHLATAVALQAGRRDDDE